MKVGSQESRLAYRYLKRLRNPSVHEASARRQRAHHQQIHENIDPKLAATEFDFVSSLMPDYCADA